jgi:membrane-associated phospholipid phosphatase
MPSRLLAALILCLATPAIADDVIPGHQTDPAIDGAVIAGALGLGLGLSLIPVPAPRGTWRRELFGGFDASVHASFSPRAAQISDAALGVAVAAPIAYLTGGTVEDADGDRLVIYGEALAINLALFQGAKRLVQRPRPYLYSASPGVARYAASQGADAYRSFYSAHAATAFCAATAGAYLAATTERRGVRRAAWGSGFAAAGAVANLRVRAGKHFYSDVAIGALIGTAIGYAVPALHADARPYVPDAADLGAALAGLIAGGLVSQLLPLERRRDDELVARRPRWSRALRSMQLAPVAVPGGSGVGVAGSL